MKHVISLSGGKDSTALLLWSLERGEHFDEVIYFDTGWEYPQMTEHLQQLQQDVPVQIVTVKADPPLDYCFSERVRTKGRLKGVKGYGFCNSMTRWCTKIKTQTIAAYLKKRFSGEQVCQWIGLAADEPRRIKTDKLATGEVRYPLVEWGKTERDCLEYCYSKGYRWGGLYEHKSRVSCWCCPLQSLKDLEVLYRYHPALWQKLKEMQARSIRNFRSDYSLYGLEQIFIEHKQL